APQQPSTNRRRLIQLGAGSVPVALTLASRPVFAAGQCNTTSAWGSAILRNGVGSVKARAAAARIDNPVWSLSQLRNDSAGIGVGGGNPPWAWIYQQRYGGAALGKNQTPSDYAQATLKISDLFPAGINGQTGGPDTVYGYIHAHNSTSNFVTSLLVARLNALYAGSGASLCLASSPSTDVLAEMARGTFQPSNGTGGFWSNSDVLQYLLDNNYVVA
ncbi:hypothetical protein, partial [Pelomonas sp. KK5]|uniref:hypothetical protein n=1 Tax=Pelomonas sp. KK5 TaxID=1855730 RepID=UPI001301E508